MQDGRAAQRRRRSIWAVVLLLLLLTVRLSLTPLAAWRTRRILGSLRGYQADFSDVSVSLLRLSYSIDGLALRSSRETRASDLRASLRVKHIEIGLDLRAMVRRRAVVAAVDVDEPKLELAVPASGGGTLGDTRTRDRIFRLSPLAIERVQIRRADIVFAERKRTTTPAVQLHDLDAALENLATRPAMSAGEPALLAASGTLMKTGQVSVFVTADPFARRVTFSGRASVKGLDAREIGSFLADAADLVPRRGTIDLIAAFHVRDGHLWAGVKPVLKDVEVESARPGLAPKLKQWLVEKSQRPGSRPDAHRAASGFIPVHGDVVKPQAETWPTVLRLLRNAFATGLSGAIDDLSRRRAEPRARAPSRTRSRR